MEHSWTAIACGAVSYGLSVRDVREGIAPSGSGTVGSRIARFSYGVSADEPFLPGLHPSNKMYYSPLTGSFWCRGRMQWFVKMVSFEPTLQGVSVDRYIAIVLMMQLLKQGLHRMNGSQTARILKSN